MAARRRPSATTRIASSCAPTARRPTSPPTSPTSSTSSSAASTWRSTCSAPTTTATSARLRAGAAALGYDPERIEVPIYQMVHLTEGGETKRMSKRRGDVVLLDELMDVIGVDAARFYLRPALARPADRARHRARQASRAARTPSTTCSTRTPGSLRSCGGAGDRAEGAAPDAALAPEPSEAALVRALAEFPRVAAGRPTCARRIASWPMRPISPPASTPSTATARCSTTTICPAEARLALCDATRGVLARSLDLVGVDAPEEM